MPDEADVVTETPFDVSRYQKSGEHQEPSEVARRALGLPEEKSPATETKGQQSKPDPKTSQEQKSDVEGQKLVDNYSAKIQEKAEELYATDERLALRDPTHLDQLLSSTDKVDRRNAEKILQRNAKTFGASTVEDYRLQKEKLAAGDDPTRQKFVEIDHELRSLKIEKKATQWKEWKLENSIKGELGKFADEIYSQYPEMTFVDVLDLAKGRLGIRTHAVPGKEEGSIATGAGNPSQNEEISPNLKRLLRIRPETEKFAREYLGY